MDQSTLNLVKLAQAGDRGAYGLLAQQFWKTVYGVSLDYLGVSADAQDLTQEVLLHAMHKLSQLRQPERFSGWIRRIAVNMAVNRLLKRRKTVELQENVIDSVPKPLDTLLAKERVQVLHLALDRLTPIDRATLVSFYFNRRSIKEMSKDFKSAEGTIKRRLHYARHRLREKVEELYDLSNC